MSRPTLAPPSTLLTAWAVMRALLQYFSTLKWIALIAGLCFLVSILLQLVSPSPLARMMMMLPLAALMMLLVFGVPAGLRLFAGSTRSALLPGLHRTVFLLTLGFSLLPALVIVTTVAAFNITLALLCALPLACLLSVNAVLTHVFVKPASAVLSKLAYVFAAIELFKWVGKDVQKLVALQLPALLIAAAVWAFFYRWLCAQPRLPRMQTVEAHNDSILSLFARIGPRPPGKNSAYRTPAIYLLRGSSDKISFRILEAFALVFGFPLGMTLFLAAQTALLGGEGKLSALANSPLPALFLMFLMFPFAMQGFLLQARVRNLRKLWLKSGADRPQLFRLLETQTLFDVAVLALAVLAYLSVCSLAGVPSLPNLWTTLLYWFAVTLSPLYLVMGLLARGLTPLHTTLVQMLPMATAMIVLFSAIFSESETPALALAAGLLALLPFCRAFARRAWQQVDFHRLRPVRIFR